MANSGSPFLPGLANGALTAKTIAKVGASDRSYAPAGDNGLGVGVVKYDAADGAHCTIQYTGVAKVIAGGSVTRGNRIAADADSKGVPAVAGENYVGIALESASADEEFDVLLSIGMVDSDT